MKKRVFTIIQIGNKDDIPSRIFDGILALAILANIAAMFLETFASLSEWMGLFHAVEAVTIAFFCIEYILRIWTADDLYPKLSGWKARLKFLVSFEGLIDLLTILPSFSQSGFVAFRMLRVVRVLHLFRINNQYDSFHIIVDVLNERKNQIFSSLVIILILMLASSLGMYNAEHEAQPEAFANAFSGIWWSAAALLTIGYGDLYPVTVMGRILAMVIAFLGVGVVAIPTGIISAGFVEKYKKERYADITLQDIREIGEILITREHLFAGKIIEEIEEVYSTQVMLVLRGGLTVMATSNLQVEAGDILVVNSSHVVKEPEKAKERNVKNGTRRTKRK